MKTIFVLLMCSVPMFAYGDEAQIMISIENVSEVEFGNESHPGFTLNIPQELNEGDLISAYLKVNAKAGDDCESNHFEIQVAQIVNGEILVPSGKTRPASEVADYEDYEALYIDIEPILADCLSASEYSPIVVVGGISEDSISCGDLSILDSDNNLWGEIIIYYR